MTESRLTSFSKSWLRSSKRALPALLLLAGMFGGCKEDAPEATQTGTETNWLKACDASDECGVGSCICGRCTYECKGAADCASAPEPARCSSDSETATLCGDSSTEGICIAADTSTDDDAMDDDAADDDATTDDDTADDETVAGDDVAADDDVADDDTVGADDDVVADDDASGDDGTGGTAGNLGVGGMSSSNGGTGAGGSSGTGGSASLSCDASCTEICENGVCGCACDPTADWAMCEVPSDCVLLPSDCCTCSEFDAVNTEQTAAHAAAVCPEAMECDACQPEPDPYRVATCIDNVCTVAQLDETPLTECATASDCILREPTCCPSCGVISDPLTQLVAIASTQALEMNALLCDEDLPCPPCVTEFPQDTVAACEAGRCVVTTSTPTAPECPAPEGTSIDVTVSGEGSAGTAYECRDRAVTTTLITSEQELDDFFTQCESLNQGPARPIVDFSSRVLFVAAVPERPALSWLYAVATPEVVHVGVDAPAYCGGVFPRTGALLIEMDVPTLPVELDVCYSGVCSGPPPP